MATKSMELMVKITANGAAAIGQLRATSAAIGKFGADVSSAGRGAFNFGRGALDLAFKPLKYAAMGGAALGAAFLGVSAKSVQAAGNMETLRLRLEGVAKSSEEAAAIYKDTMDLAMKSPFESNELVDARIQLMNIGLSGSDAIRAIGDASAITQKPLADLASMVASMETEPLRRIGISLKREGEQYSFSFRDRMQKTQTMAAQGAEAARKSLLSIFDIKYGGGMGKLAGTFAGMTSTLRDNLSMAAAKFGESLMPVVKDVIAFLSEKLGKLIDSGKLTEWGDKVANVLTTAFDYGVAFFQAAGEFLEGGAKNWQAGFTALMEGMAKTLWIAIVEYFKAGKDLFFGIGAMMASGLGEALLGSGIPGMDLLAAGAATKQRAQMGSEEYSQFVAENRGLSDEKFNAKMAMRGSDKLFAAGATRAFNAVPDAIARTKERIADVWKDANADIQNVTGFDVFGRTRDLAASAQADRIARRPSSFEPYEPPAETPAAAATEVVMPAAPKRSDYIADYRMPRRQAAPRPRTGANAPLTGSAVNISHLTVRANSTAQMERHLMRAGWRPNLSPAGS